MKTVKICFLIIIYMGSIKMATADTAINNLTCEYLQNPLGIDVPQPRLSWMLRSDKRGESQSAYQIIVASSAKILAAGKGDLWDSGKIASAQSIHVAYAGKELASEMRCHWKVRVWDHEGKPLPWSKPAFWTMGLLSPKDWKGQWIAAEAELPRSETVTDAQWIWYPEGAPRIEAPVAKRYFRKTIELAQPPKSARLAVTADDSSEVFLNGHSVGNTKTWTVTQDFDVTQYMTSGTNVLAIAAINDGGAAGLIARLVIEPQSGEPVTVTTDGSWKSSTSEVPNWTDAGFDDSAWPTALVLGPADSQPWGKPYPLTKEAPSPLLRKTFKITKTVKKAYAYTCGLGFYELHLNGKKVGDEVLQPGFTSYDKRALYVTKDVTGLLKSGGNVVGVILGNGWFNVQAHDIWNFERAPWRNTPRLLLQLNIEYSDGTSEIIVSDGSWKTAAGPIVFDGIRNGENYDARLEKPGWDTADYSDTGWKAVELVNAPAGKLMSQKTAPVRVTKIVNPVNITEPKPGVFVFDFGQNLAGRGRLRVSGPAGTTITIKYDERLLEDGTLDQRNRGFVAGQFQTDTYILKGKGVEVWEPCFAYEGFQYAQVEGFPGKPTLKSLVACVVHTDFESGGTFECSNDLLNHIQRNALWSYLSNFAGGYPTDCPHREKNGWTGDAHLASEMGFYNFNPAASYTKWIDDFDDAQDNEGGFPGIVPTGGWGYGIGPAWDSAYILIPWYTYLYCGDKHILSAHYDGFKRYVDFLTGKAKGHIVSYGLGDWCPPERGANEPKSPAALTSTGYYYIDTLIVSKIARLLGKDEDAKKYSELAEVIRKAFNEKFYDAASGLYTGNCQTSQATALYQGLAQPEEDGKILATLLTEIDNHNGHLDCGILGTKYLLHVLTDRGRVDVAYKIATQRTFPSWGHWIEQGATTLWEDWHGGASLNHIMFGDISAWFYEALAGINPDPDNPGFKHIIIRPRPVDDLKWARAEHVSMYGRIRSAWTKQNGKFTLEIEIPANTTATVYIPYADAGKITENGKPVSHADGVKLIGSEDGCTVLSVGAGTYKFTATP